MSSRRTWFAPSDAEAAWDVWIRGANGDQKLGQVLYRGGRYTLRVWGGDFDSREAAADGLLAQIGWCE